MRRLMIAAVALASALALAATAAGSASAKALTIYASNNNATVTPREKVHVVLQFVPFTNKKGIEVGVCENINVYGFVSTNLASIDTFTAKSATSVCSSHKASTGSFAVSTTRFGANGKESIGITIKLSEPAPDAACTYTGTLKGTNPTSGALQGEDNNGKLTGTHCEEPDVYIAALGTHGGGYTLTSDEFGLDVKL